MSSNVRQFYCNKCMKPLALFQLPSIDVEPGRITRIPKQYLTNCSHVLCGECRSMNRVQTCAVCKRQCMFMEITFKMPKTYRWFFDSQAIKQLILVSKFQRKQNEMAMHRFERKIERYRQSKSYQSKRGEIAKYNFRRAQLRVKRLQNLYRWNRIRKIRRDEEKRRKKLECKRQREQQLQGYYQRMREDQYQKQQFDAPTRRYTTHDQDQNDKEYDSGFHFSSSYS